MTVMHKDRKTGQVMTVSEVTAMSKMLHYRNPYARLLMASKAHPVFTVEAFMWPKGSE